MANPRSCALLSRAASFRFCTRGGDDFPFLEVGGHDKSLHVFADFYKSDLQAAYALWPAPAFFLLYWLLSRPLGRPGVEPRATSFLNVYAPLFAIETLIDPFATGPLLRWLRVEAPTTTYTMLAFVLLGDFRVYLLIFFVLAPERGVGGAVVQAGLWTLVVPVFAWTANALLESRFGTLPPQTIWIVYELGFVAVALFLEMRLLPSRLGLRRFEVHQYLRALLRYAELYYGLWATADLLILWHGLEWGWVLRVIPNQLYYAFWVPFAYLSFFSPRYAATRSAARASR
jgi:hypothetical protein